MVAVPLDTVKIDRLPACWRQSMLVHLSQHIK